MNVGILSGKGGTGKTTVSTNLALMMNANYIDCDVEEPNGFIFLNPENVQRQDVQVDVPIIDKGQCTGCGECVRVCGYHALAQVKQDIIIFDKLCHSCGACQIACKDHALKYQKRKIGVVEEGTHMDITCMRGILDIGEPMAVPVIKALLKQLPQGMNIIDCSPGTSCNVVNTLQYVDTAILVTEPTVFGLHDLKIAVGMVRMFNIPFGIVINKYMKGNSLIEDYCEQEKISLYGVIPYSKNAAIAYSEGKMLIELQEYQSAFATIAAKVRGH